MPDSILTTKPEATVSLINILLNYDHLSWDQSYLEKSFLYSNWKSSHSLLTLPLGFCSKPLVPETVVFPLPAFNSDPGTVAIAGHTPFSIHVHVHDIRYRKIPYFFTISLKGEKY